MRNPLANLGDTEKKLLVIGLPVVAVAALYSVARGRRGAPTAGQLGPAPVIPGGLAGGDPLGWAGSLSDVLGGLEERLRDVEQGPRPPSITPAPVTPLPPIIVQMPPAQQVPAAQAPAVSAPPAPAVAPAVSVSTHGLGSPVLPSGQINQRTQTTRVALPDGNFRESRVTAGGRAISVVLDEDGRRTSSVHDTRVGLATSIVNKSTQEQARSRHVGGAGLATSIVRKLKAQE